MIKSFGTDSEFFLYDEEDNFVPAYNVTKGTKDEHEVILEDSKYGTVSVHWDNVALEVTADPLFVDNLPPYLIPVKIANYLGFVYRSVHDWANQKGLRISLSPVVHLDKMTALDDEANIFGCEPDFNVYLNGEQNPSPSPSKAKGLRTAGAHFHFGLIDVDNRELKNNLILNLDRSVYSYEYGILNSSAIKDSHTRRSLYGMAGSYRDKEYGIEYRVASPLAYKDLNFLSNELFNAIVNTASGVKNKPEHNKIVVNYLNGNKSDLQNITAEWVSINEVVSHA